MRIDKAVYDTLVEVCNTYPYPVVQKGYHLGEILNYVAWIHRDKGYGLSRKTGGQLVDSPVGFIAEDILQLPDGNHFDVLTGAREGSGLSPSYADSIGIINLSARPWVAPVQATLSWAASSPTQPGTPPVIIPAPVTPAPTVSCKFQIQDCKCNYSEADIHQMGKRIEELAIHFDEIAQRLEVTLSRIEAKPSQSCRLRF